jgi:hypothetical protein
MDTGLWPRHYPKECERMYGLIGKSAVRCPSGILEAPETEPDNRVRAILVSFQTLTRNVFASCRICTSA